MTPNDVLTKLIQRAVHIREGLHLGVCKGYWFHFGDRFAKAYLWPKSPERNAEAFAHVIERLFPETCARQHQDIDRAEVLVRDLRPRVSHLSRALEKSHQPKLP